MRQAGVVLATMVLVAACARTLSGGNQPNGAPGQPCYPNDTCNHGSSCVAGRCVGLGADAGADDVLDQGARDGSQRVPDLDGFWPSDAVNPDSSDGLPLTDATAAAESSAGDGMAQDREIQDGLSPDLANTASVSTFAGVPGVPGRADGPLLDARFSLPKGLALGPDGVLYVADSGNHRIRRIANGRVTTLAGSTEGYLNARGVNARFAEPTGVAYDSATDALYVADTKNHRIRRILLSTEDVSTYAGSGAAGYTNGALSQAQFREPTDVLADPFGTVWIADRGNNALRQANTSTVRTASENRQGICGLSSEPSGTLFISLCAGHRILRAVGSTMLQYAGTGLPGYVDDRASSAQFRVPAAVAFDPRSGDVLVADSANHRIRRISSGRVSTFAGSSRGHADGPLDTARFSDPQGLIVGPQGTIYIADTRNHVIRRISQ